MWHCLNANADKWATAWWKTLRSGSTIQAAAEQVTESAAAPLLVCSCHKCRFVVVTCIVILLKNYAISCWHPYSTLLQEIIWDVRKLQSEWFEVVKMPWDPILGQITYTCTSADATPDTWARLGYLQSSGRACGDSVGKTNPLMWDITPKIAVYLWKRLGKVCKNYW